MDYSYEFVGEIPFIKESKFGEQIINPLLSDILILNEYLERTNLSSFFPEEIDGHYLLFFKSFWNIVGLDNDSLKNFVNFVITNIEGTGTYPVFLEVVKAFFGTEEVTIVFYELDNTLLFGEIDLNITNPDTERLAFYIDNISNRYNDKNFVNKYVGLENEDNTSATDFYKEFLERFLCINTTIRDINIII